MKGPFSWNASTATAARHFSPRSGDSTATNRTCPVDGANSALATLSWVWSVRWKLTDPAVPKSPTFAAYVPLVESTRSTVSGMRKWKSE
jgi:hypothetical protein